MLLLLSLLLLLLDAVVATAAACLSRGEGRRDVKRGTAGPGRAWPGLAGRGCTIYGASRLELGSSHDYYGPLCLSYRLQQQKMQRRAGAAALPSIESVLHTRTSPPPSTGPSGGDYFPKEGAAGVTPPHTKDLQQLTLVGVREE